MAEAISRSAAGQPEADELGRRDAARTNLWRDVERRHPELPRTLKFWQGPMTLLGPTIGMRVVLGWSGVRELPERLRQPHSARPICRLSRLALSPV